MADIKAQQQTHVIAKDYNIDARPELGGRRQVLSEGENYIVLANRELNTAILIKYNADDLVLP